MSSENMGDEPSPTQEHKTPADVLLAAAELLEKPGAWTQGAASRDAFGNSDDDNEILPDAVCWCAWGAILRVSGCTKIGTGYSRKAEPAYDRLKEFIGVDVPIWNDHPSRTQSEVVETLRKAAALAREAGQ